MAKIDEIKEELNYLKVWLGIVVVTTISLISWLINNYEIINYFKNYSAVIAIIVMTITILVIDNKIKKRIKKLRNL